MKIHENVNKFEKCEGLIKLCLKKEPESRVANASILSKNHNIESLIYQHNHGLSPCQYSFSESLADVVQRVNAKLLEEIDVYKKTIRQLQSKNESHRSLIDRLREDHITEIKRKEENFIMELNVEGNKYRELKKELETKKSALANSKRANQEKTKQLKNVKMSTIFSRDGQQNGLGN